MSERRGARCCLAQIRRDLRAKTRIVGYCKNLRQHGAQPSHVTIEATRRAVPYLDRKDINNYGANINNYENLDHHNFGGVTPCWP